MSAKGPTSWTAGWLVAAWLLIALALGAAIASEGPTWPLVGLAVLLTVVAAALRVAWALSASLRPNDGPVPCPRCGEAPRTSTGWCAKCTVALQRNPAPRDHPLADFVAAGAQGAGDEMARFVTPDHTLEFPNGRVVNLPPEQLAITARNFRRWVREPQSRVIGFYVDPADADTLWVHSQDSGERRYGLGRYSVRLTMRYRLRGEMIAETRYFPPLRPV